MTCIFNQILKPQPTFETFEYFGAPQIPSCKTGKLYTLLEVHDDEYMAHLFTGSQDPSQYALEIFDPDDPICQSIFNHLSQKDVSSTSIGISLDK